MGADVAGRAGGTGAGRIGAPAGLLLAGVLELGREPVLDVLGLHEPNGPELALGHHLPRLPDHGVAGIVVRQHEDAARLLDQFGELARILEGRGHRLVADDVDAAIEERLGRREVDVVGRDDRHRVDPVLAPRLALGHLGEVAVAARRIEAQLLARGLRLLGRGGERAGHQLVAPVQTGGDPVHPTDERPLPAADHAQPQPAARPGFRLRTLAHHARLSSLVRQLRPGAVVPARGQHGLDEAHAVEPVSHIRAAGPRRARAPAPRAAPRSARRHHRTGWRSLRGSLPGNRPAAGSGARPPGQRPGLPRAISCGASPSIANRRTPGSSCAQVSPPFSP